MSTKLPKLIRFLSAILFIEVLLFTVFRLAFYFGFAKYGSDFTFNDVLYSFWIGFRFDLQLSIFIILPLFLFGGIKYIGLYKSSFAKYFWLLYLLLVNIAVVVLYVINFAYYDFFKKLVDNNIIRYFYDFGEAFKMAQEGYPVNSAIAIACVSFLVIFILLRKLYGAIDKRESCELHWKKKVSIYSVFTVLVFFGGYGKTELFPWRWSEAFWSSNGFLSSLSSNPVIYFSNTLKNTDVKYDKEAMKKFYPYVADFLEVQDKDFENYSLLRVSTPTRKLLQGTKKPNIVFILGESTGYARTSMSGNPLNPTPHLDKMAKDGILHTMYLTPHSGTARSVWTAMTGLVDVERMKTSSRNPMIAEQHMILNALTDYKKFYFIGGSLSWGNVRGVIGNVDGLVTREEASYDSPRNDVWGISDAHLAHEVHKTLKEQKEPFFAFVQLAGNHSPNTIPDENFGFTMPETVDEESLLKYSFDGSQDELIGQKFLDHSVGLLIKLAQEESYFDNTIFIFAGDHGLPRRADHLHKADMIYGTATLRTPLIFYAPKLLNKQETINYPVSEVDIMATIAGLSGTKYINTTLGRDILEESFVQKPHYAFYMTHEDNPTIRLVGEEFILQIRADGSERKLFKYLFEKENEDLATQFPEEADKMEKICRGMYESARYVRYYNRTSDVTTRLQQVEKKEISLKRF